MKLLCSFVWRDLQMEMAYKMKLLTDIVYVMVAVVLYYYVSRLVGTRPHSQLEQYHCDYFTFVMVGIALANLMQAGLQTFSENVRKFIAEGSLEAMLATPTPHFKLIAYSAAWPFCYAIFKTALQFTFAHVAFGLTLRKANLLSTIVSVALSLALFIAMGIISASALVVFKRGDPVNWLIIQLSHVFGGILFPVGLLPHWAQIVAWAFPVRHALEAVRSATLTGTTIGGMRHELIPLIGFTLALVPVSSYACTAFVNSSKRSGSTSIL